MPDMTATITGVHPLLILTHPRQPALRVTTGRGWWEVWSGDDRYATIPPLRACLANIAAASWRDTGNGTWDLDRPMPRFWRVDDQGVDRTVHAHPGARHLEITATGSRAIAKHLTDEILAPLQAGLDATVHAVWRRLSSCAPLGTVDRGRCAPLCDWFWDHPFLAHDVLTIRGAALVVRSLMETYDDPDMTPAWEALQAGDWQRACCPGTRIVPYRALRVTLAQCPGQLPVQTLSLLHLRGVQLPRPRRTRLEVLSAMAVGRHALGRGSWYNRDLILNADDQQLRQALPPMREDLFDGVVHTPISYRAYQVADLLDYPDPCPDLLTLARCSAEWHVIGHLNPHPSLLGQATQNPLEPTAVPPREPPTDPEPGVTIRRLTTVGEVLAEGRLMHHCVGGYTARAVAGLCFLYHVEVGDEMATVELDRHLRLVQARGPSNLTNAASHYAEQRFADLVVSQEDDACVPF